MIALDAVRDQSINTVIEQIGKENVMKTLLLSLMQKHTSDGLTFVQAKLDKPRLWNHRRYHSVTPSSGISQGFCLWEPPCWQGNAMAYPIRITARWGLPVSLWVPTIQHSFWRFLCVPFIGPIVALVSHYHLLYPLSCRCSTPMWQRHK